MIARLLKPGGAVSVFDDHPVTWLFDPETEMLVATGYDYFAHSDSSQGWPATYIGDLDVPVTRSRRSNTNASGLCLRSSRRYAGRVWSSSRSANIARNTGTASPSSTPQSRRASR